ncbi:MAG TPA: glycosyltransferase, partial [Candidatus Gracilibacteria bacterium]|nr:glycosyltransferase [Candidatus Gracilibacteria bacterium]
IVVISNGINPALFPPAHLHMSGKIIDTSHPSALFVGRIAYEKNLLALVDIFEKVLTDVPEGRLYIIGGGPQTVQLKRYVEKKGLQENIRLVGEIPHAELVKSGAYQTADVFVSASKTENQPVTVLEAQCNGLPCVGMDAKGIPDMIANDRNGFVVPKDDIEAFAGRIVQLFRDKELRARMKKESLAYAHQHRLDSVIDEWEKAYGHVVQNYKPKKRFERLRAAPARAKERLHRARKSARAMLDARSARRKARRVGKR